MFKVFLIVISAMWLVGCEGSNPFASNKVSLKMSTDAVNLTCPDDLLFDIEACSQFLQQQFLPTAKAFVHLDAGKINVSMLDGRIATIDTLDNTRVVCASNEDKRFLFLRQIESTGGMEAYDAWLLFDRLTGELTFVSGQPIFSTLGNYIVVHSIDIDAEFTPTLLDVYEVRNSGLSRVFNGINSEPVSWGPENVVWQDEQTILFDEVRHNPQSNGNNELHVSVRKSLLHLNGRWLIK